jgi:hypothetical protein
VLAVNQGVVESRYIFDLMESAWKKPDQLYTRLSGEIIRSALHGDLGLSRNPLYLTLMLDEEIGD